MGHPRPEGAIETGKDCRYVKRVPRAVRLLGVLEVIAVMNHWFRSFRSVLSCVAVFGGLTITLLLTGCALGTTAFPDTDIVSDQTPRCRRAPCRAATSAATRRWWARTCLCCRRVPAAMGARCQLAALGQRDDPRSTTAPCTRPRWTARERQPDLRDVLHHHGQPGRLRAERRLHLHGRDCRCTCMPRAAIRRRCRQRGLTVNADQQLYGQQQQDACGVCWSRSPRRNQPAVPGRDW
jgi:hypothetical protein